MNNKMEEELIKKINEWHKYVVNGMVNGITHTIHDGRTKEIDYWVKRCILFESFSRCIMDMIWGNPNEYNEKELKEVSEEGYKK